MNPGTGGTTNNCTQDANATWTLAKNVMPFYDNNTTCYPSQSIYGNSFPSNYDRVGFTDLANGVYSLSPSSIYKRTAQDGPDPGVDIAVLNERTSCSVSGKTAPCIGAPLSSKEKSLVR